MRLLVSLLALMAVPAACSPPVPAAQQRALSPAARQTFARLIVQYDADIATLQRARDGTISGALGSHLSADASAAAAELRDDGARIARQSEPRAQSVAAPRPGAIGPQTLTQYQSAAAQRVTRAIGLRAQQLREREADTAFDFERAHAGQRLTLELKLHALHLAPAGAARYRERLHALTQREENAVAAQRARDRAVLDGYAARLRAQAAGGVASLAGELRARAAAARTIPTPSVGALPADLTRDERGASASAFSDARQDVERRFSELRAEHDASQASLASEIAALEKERDALRAALKARSSFKTPLTMVKPERTSFALGGHDGTQNDS